VLTTLRMTNRAVSLHLEQSRRVIRNAKSVSEALAATASADTREEEINSTARELESSAAQTGMPDSGIRGFETGKAEDRQPALTVADQLTIAVADAAVAQVLFAASQAVGEKAARTAPEVLQMAIESAGDCLESLQATALNTYGFAAQPPPKTNSANLQQALDTFRNQAHTAVSGILDTADNTVSRDIKKVWDQRQKIVEAFSQASAFFEALPENAALLRRAWDKLLSALHTLQKISAALPVDEAKSFLDKLAKADILRVTLESIFRTKSVSNRIAAVPAASRLSIQEVDELSDKMVFVEAQNSTMVGYVSSIVKIATPCLSLLAVHSGLALAPLAAPACYSLEIVSVAALGYDAIYTGFLHSGSAVSPLLDELVEGGPP
jgi:hypothetical protein